MFRAGGITIALGVAAAFAACDNSVQVGDLKALPDDDAGALPLPDHDAATDGPAFVSEWRLQSPPIPCSIYSMSEVRSDRLYVGCTGGRVYRFDGVSAHPELEIADNMIFSFVWVAPDGQVWAAAQDGYGQQAAGELHRFDGKTWANVALPTQERIVALGGFDAESVFAATAGSILRFDGTSWSSVHDVTNGEVNDCVFAAKDRGYCVGTSGLALAWNGTAFAPLSGAPWSAQADVLGADVDPFDASITFVYGEPASDPHGDHMCRAARFEPGTAKWTSYTAAQPCFVTHDVPHRRVSHVVVGGPSYPIVAPDETYGGTLLFDRAANAWRSVCGPAVTYSAGGASTRAGGRDGLLATFVGSGSQQLSLDPFGGSGQEFDALSVAPDGTAWARVERTTTCESVTQRIVRLDGSAWQEIAAPTNANTGEDLAAVSRDELYTISLGSGDVAQYQNGDWRALFPRDSAWSLWAANDHDVWVGGSTDDFGHFDGTRFDEVHPPGRRRQIEQTVATPDGDVWMVARGTTQDDARLHVYHYDAGQLAEWDEGIEKNEIRVAALDRAHAWISGSPARAWDGSAWHDLPFEASGVWARGESDVWFSQYADLLHWDGKKVERRYKGFVPIMHLSGSRSRGVAVGPGGLTIVFADWPAITR